MIQNIFQRDRCTVVADKCARFWSSAMSSTLLAETVRELPCKQLQEKGFVHLYLPWFVFDSNKCLPADCFCICISLNVYPFLELSWPSVVLKDSNIFHLCCLGERQDFALGLYWETEENGRDFGFFEF